VDCRCANWYDTVVILISESLVHSYYVGVPHSIDTDDIYNGYLIPGESIIMANIWLVLLYLLCVSSQRIDRSMTRNEEIYPDAEAFKPERFIKNGALSKEVRDPREFVFGFGRRCVFFRFSRLRLILP
jgi:hypothetical protein